MEKRNSLPNFAGNRGFTLVELLVVVVIMGILATLVVPRLMEQPKIARQKAAIHDISAIMTALDIYALNNVDYPTTEEGLQMLVENRLLKNTPVDPWGNEYYYTNEGDGVVLVWSHGEDGAPGGEGYAADIDSDNLED